MNVESEQGKGTVFQLFIPYTIAGEGEIVPAVPALLSAVLASSGSAASDIHLLVVDDNVMNRNLMRHLLESRHFSFEIVSNGREPIENLQQRKYDLVFMVIQMPEMDRNGASRYIRSECGL